MQNNQQDIVRDYVIQNKDTNKEVTDRLKWPGLSELATKPKEEIADTLVNILKSRANITRINWEIGQYYIEISYIAR
jgi:hypothetical protein